MKIDTEEKKDLAEIILGINQDPHRKSTLNLALESAYSHLGTSKLEDVNDLTFAMRHKRHHRIMNNEEEDINSDESELFTALLLLLVSLEQIGVLFCKKDEICKGNGIKRAIKTFISNKLDDNEIRAISNLRNSLAHSFGLVNMPKNANSYKPTKYSIVLSLEEKKDTKILRLPIIPWTGNWKCKNEEDTSCIIYAYPLIRFIMSIINTVKDRYRSGQLEFALEDIEEIRTRFTILI